MVEVLIAGALVTAGLAVVIRIQHDNRLPDRSFSAASPYDLPNDLPCPWCQAATNEDDDRCPSCGQRFG